MKDLKNNFLKTKITTRTNNVAISDIGKVRQINQDAYASCSTVNGEVFIVCDGMGGTELGAEASLLATKSVINTISKKWQDNIFNLIDEAIKTANKEVYALSKNKGKSAGTTIALALIKNNTLYYAHVGDSRLYYLSGGRFFELTKDHSLVQSLLDKGLITKNEARIHPKRNIILKALGVDNHIEPEICKETITPNDDDYILMCSDGLTNELSNEAIHEILEKDISLNQKAELLIDDAKRYGGNDNITVQLIHFSKQKTKRQVNSLPKNQQKEKKSRKKKIIISVLVLIFAGMIYPVILLKDRYNRANTKNQTCRMVMIPATTELVQDNDSVSSYVINKIGGDVFLYSHIFKINIEDIIKANGNKLYLKTGELINIPKKQN